MQGSSSTMSRRRSKLSRRRVSKHRHSLTRLVSKRRHSKTSLRPKRRTSRQYRSALGNCVNWVCKDGICEIKPTEGGNTVKRRVTVAPDEGDFTRFWKDVQDKVDDLAKKKGDISKEEDKKLILKNALEITGVPKGAQYPSQDDALKFTAGQLGQLQFLNSLENGSVLTPESKQENADEARAQALVRNSPGFVFINAKPGRQNVFNLTEQGISVNFNNKKGKQLFRLPKQIIMVDDQLKDKVNYGDIHYAAVTDIVTTFLAGTEKKVVWLLFGPSGSGKTVNAEKILNKIIDNTTDICVEIEATRLYGKAKYQSFEPTPQILFNAVSTKSKSLYQKRNPANNSKSDLVKRATKWLLEDKSIRQTVNNKTSSRCCVAYKCVFDSGREFVLVDAPGNESPADLIKGMFKHPKMDSSTEDQLIAELMSAKTNALHDFTLIDGLNRNRDVVEEYRRLLGHKDYDDWGKKAVYPQNASVSTDWINYCILLIEESLYINLLIGQLSKRLKKVPELVQRMPLLLLKHAAAAKESLKYDADLVCAGKDHKKPCEYHKARFAYAAEGNEMTPRVGGTPRRTRATKQTGPMSLQKSNDYVEKIHNEKRSQGNALEAIFPLMALIGDIPEYKALIITAYKADADKEKTLRHATTDLTNQLFGVDATA